MTEKDDVLAAIAKSKAEMSKWSDPEEYWNKFLKSNNQTDIQRIKTNYPQDCLLTVDLKKVFDNKMWKHILESRMGATIEAIQQGCQTLLLTYDPKGDYVADKIKVRLLNVPRQKKISDLRIDDINSLLGVKCLVKRVTEVRPKITRAAFRCAAGHEMVVTAGYNSINAPKSCSMTGCLSRTIERAPGRDLMVNRQFAVVQEPLDELRTGAMPSSLVVEMIGELCNTIMIGDTITLNGAYLAVDKMKGGVLDATKDVYFALNNAEVGNREFDDVVITEEEERQIKELATNPNIFLRLSNSIAPTILGMTLTKSVVALLLFGGVTKILRDGSVIRGDINALVVSDPGMGKTILLKYAARVAPRGIFANATTSTKVGLVASVQKDEMTGHWSIEAGAYMLASGGVFCLDEMSELTKEDTKMLNECMENGEAHINKAGINATVKTKAAMLAACNPKDGRFINGDVALQDQVNIDASVLSRFDVVVLLQDFASSEKDEKTADYILQNHMDSLLSVTNAEEITPDLMRKYISYARRINPVLTPEANTAIKQFYVKTRPGGENGNTIAITTRQVPALIRMAEAHARIRLSDKVTKEDAELAIEILNMSLNAVAIDPVTGQIDEDRIGNKSCKQSRGFRDDLIKVIHQMAEGTGYAKTELISGGMSLKGYPIDKIPHTLEMLAREGVLIQVKNGLWRVMT